MTWRDTSWEFLVTVFSWAAALGALVFVAAYLAIDAVQTRRKGRR